MGECVIYFCFGFKIPMQSVTYLQQGRGWRISRDFPGWTGRLMRLVFGPGSLITGNNGLIAFSIHQKIDWRHQLVDRLHLWYGNMFLAGCNFILLMLHRDIF